MKKLIFLTSFFFSFYLHAQNCPDLNGQYAAKVGEMMNYLTIQTGNNCENFLFSYNYEDRHEVSYNLIPDKKIRAIFDDGRSIIKEQSEVVDLLVGGQYQKTALKISREHIIRDEGTITVTNSYFYEEKSSTSSSLVEKRVIFNSEGQKIKTIYIGYVQVP